MKQSNLVEGARSSDSKLLDRQYSNLGVLSISPVNFAKEEKRSRGMTGSLDTTLVKRQISLSSLEGITSDSFGHSDDWNLSHSGPFHQRLCSTNSRGRRPLEAQSAGF